MDLKTFTDNFELLADTPDGIPKLREMILQLAVRGKLVSQDPNDEPASVLLEKIVEEKERLIAEGKIKKSKPLPPIAQDEVPYGLPKGWEWVRLDDLCSYLQRGKGPKYVDKSSLPVVSQKCIQWSGFRIDLARFIDPASLKKYGSERFLRNGDLLWNSTGTGTIGRITVYDHDSNDFDIVVADSHVTVVRPVFIEPYYLFNYIASPVVQEGFEERMSGTTNQIELNTTMARMQLIPLPPLAEQKRIVAKVDELMALCDELEEQKKSREQVSVSMNSACLHELTSSEPATSKKAWTRIRDNFDLLYDTPESVSALRQSILQLAVLGKLVRQNPNEEPASVLLKKIAAEKERLIAEGKIKKSKPLPPLKPDEVPYDLPMGWKWVRFVELGEFGRGKSKHRPRNDPVLYKDGKFHMIQTGDVARANGVIKTYTGLYNYDGLAQSRMWPRGTMCITIAANIADSAILGFDACFPDSVVGFIPSPILGDARYFEYFMRTAKDRLVDFAPSTAQKNINLAILNSVLVPLPPLAELQRIVAKLDKLMALCDKMETRLRDCNSIGDKLMEALVNQVTQKERE